MSNEPLVSCLCVTHQRVDLLKRAIDCFRNQSYDNRELLIIYEDLDIETADYVEKITNPQIFLLKVKSALKLTLGDLRNMSIRKCNGTYFCQWDDDDWYKDNRIEYQMKILKKQILAVQYCHIG